MTFKTKLVESFDLIALRSLRINLEGSPLIFESRVTLHKYLRRSVWILGMIVILQGCTTAPLQKSTDVQGTWETRTQIRNLENNQVQKLSLDIRSVWPEQLRLDGYGPLGIQVGTFVAQKQKFQLHLPLEKKFYFGTLSEETLSKFLKISFDPYLLIQISFDRPPTGTQWKCVKDAELLPIMCERKLDGLKIVWKERRGNEKRVVLSSEKHEIQLVYKSFKPKVEDSEALFQLNPPSSYEKIELR